MSDLINSPQHYISNGIECIECIRASMDTEQYLGYLKGNIIKYLFRSGRKENELQDFRKAMWYLARLVEERAKHEKS